MGIPVALSDGLQVVVLERRPALGRALELLLREGGLHVIGAPRTAADAGAMIAAHKPDVALLAWSSSEDAALARQVLASWAEARILVYLDGPLAPAAARAGLDAGLAGFASKAGAPSDLVAAIRRVAAGEQYVDPHFGTTPPPPAEAAAPRLTPRQREILSLLAHGLTSEQVAQRLVLSKFTIDTHIRHLMSRLGAQTRTHALALALRHREIQLSNDTVS